MRILSATAYNFCSYKKIEFNADIKGLTLISGPTGSGKSALCDLIPWVLFGVTAKGGAADEVRSWSTQEQTVGRVIIHFSDENILRVVRKRGPNDLVFSFRNSTSNWAEIRGKDLKDTQKILNEVLCMDADLYLSGAYFHEFCTSASFFTTTAKNRREITEQIVDLTLHRSLAEKSATLIKATKGALNVVNLKIRDAEGELTYSNKTLIIENKRFGDWNKNKDFKWNEIKAKAITFEEDKANNIKELEAEIDDYELNRDLEINKLKLAEQSSHDGVCPECGQSTEHKHDHDYSNRIKALKTRVNPLLALLSKEHASKNTYHKQADEIENSDNPHNDSCIELEARIKELNVLLEILKTDRLKTAMDISDLETLQETVAIWRAISVENTILHLESTTNNLIADHFDGEIQVQLTVSGDDKLEVIITKDSNECAYTQLSKGQRQLLKLSFGIAVMDAISNQHAIKFDQLFFDESLDGLDENLKLKAIGMFEYLATKHNSVYIVEHSSAIKAMVNNRIDVTLVNGESQIEKA